MVFKETVVGHDFTRIDAQKFVSHCMRYDSEIMLEMGTKKINGKSLMGIVSMVLKKGVSVTVITKGDDQEEALGEAVKLLSAKQ